MSQVVKVRHVRHLGGDQLLRFLDATWQRNRSKSSFHLFGHANSYLEQIVRPRLEGSLSSNGICLAKISDLILTKLFAGAPHEVLGCFDAGGFAAGHDPKPAPCALSSHWVNRNSGKKALSFVLLPVLSTEILERPSAWTLNLFAGPQQNPRI